MIAIVDYGLGNIRAFANVYKKLNIPCLIATSIEELKKAKKIILPGVGAFDHAMTLLNNSGLREPLDDLVLNKGIPVAGICVGMQMMATSSEEGSLEGLSWVNGAVKRLTIDSKEHATKYPLPHMGWNGIRYEQDDAIFANIETDPHFYFLHSYYLECAEDKSILANAKYGDSFCCVVKNENIYGIQFHPEKSHQNGVNLLKNFANIK